MGYNIGSATGSFLKGGCGCTLIFFGVTMIFALGTGAYFIVSLGWFLLIFLVGGISSLLFLDYKMENQAHVVYTLKPRERPCPNCQTRIESFRKGTTCPRCRMTLPTDM